MAHPVVGKECVCINHKPLFFVVFREYILSYVSIACLTVLTQPEMVFDLQRGWKSE